MTTTPTEEYELMYKVMLQIYLHPEGISTDNICKNVEGGNVKEMLHFLQSLGMIQQLFNDETTLENEWFFNDHGRFEFLKMNKRYEHY